MRCGIPGSDLMLPAIACSEQVYDGLTPSEHALNLVSTGIGCVLQPGSVGLGFYQAGSLRSVSRLSPPVQGCRPTLLSGEDAWRL